MVASSGMGVVARAWWVVARAWWVVAGGWVVARAWWAVVSYFSYQMYHGLIYDR